MAAMRLLKGLAMRKRVGLLVASVAICMLILCGSPLFAQEVTGGITGTVTDRYGSWNGVADHNQLSRCLQLSPASCRKLFR